MAIAIILSSYSVKSPMSNPTPPSGYTGAPTQNRTCRNCHGDFALNSAGGSVGVTGLPTTGYTTGQVYNFSITISNATPMQAWGFAIKAVIAGTGTAIGTFSTTNPNAALGGTELKNTTAVVSSGNSYTYTNLRWTAPATGSSAVSFYFTAIAGDDDGSEAGDYVYSGSVLGINVLPVAISDVKARLSQEASIIEWVTYSEANSSEFVIERSTDAKNFNAVKTLAAAGNSTTVKNYTGVDNNLPQNAALLYYRIKAVDLDGTSKYSGIVTLKTGVKTSVEAIYPTVVNAGALVKLQMVSHRNQPATITIFNAAGQKELTQTQNLAKGENEFFIRLNNSIGAGIHLVKIATADFSGTERLVVN